MLNRLLAIKALAVALVAMMPAAAADLELNTPGKLTVSTEGTFPPFSMRAPSGQLDGVEIRLWTEIAERLGLEYQPLVMRWESTLVGLLAGQFDVMGTTMDITPTRAEQILYSDGWLQSGGVLVVREGSDIASVEDMAGRIIGALTASTYIEHAQPFGPAAVRAYQSESDALQDLVNGNIEGVVTDQVAAAYAIKTSGLPLRIAEGFVSEVQKGWGFQKTRPNLARAVNQALADMKADGTYAAIMTEILGIVPMPADPIRSNF
ncbi:MAG: amino acid ABC transporter [Geminicoccaceae bacterium]|nr:MAG: amino acid ABC transporter [Geminicoccaceae bacterium]